MALVAQVSAQSSSAFEIPPPVLTIDQDRVFSESQLGARATAEIEADAEALSVENQAIESDLTTQERTLTDQRSTMTPEAFSVLADEFDEKVQRIRAEQDEKARAITAAREAVRQQFFGQIAGVISEIVRERGALMVLDRRDVFLSADSIDITNEAIQRINQALSLGEGPEVSGQGD